MKRKSLRFFVTNVVNADIWAFGWVKSSHYPKYFPKSIYGHMLFHYIRHYSSAKFHEMMKRYRSHEIKSRPNGQKRCYVSRDVRFYRNGRIFHVTYCSYVISPRYDMNMNKIGEVLERREERLSKISRSTFLNLFLFFFLSAFPTLPRFEYQML